MTKIKVEKSCLMCEIQYPLSNDSAFCVGCSDNFENISLSLDEEPSYLLQNRCPLAGI